MEKAVHLCVCILLVSIALLSGVSEAKKKKPEGVTVVEDRTGDEECPSDRYYCAKTCEPEDPNDPEEPDPPFDFLPDTPFVPPYPLWGSYAEIVETTVTPVTLYLNENNDVATDMSVKFDIPFALSGSDLWEVSLWFSKYKDGSGRQTNLIEETLTQRQKDKTAKPDRKFGLADLDQNVDLSDGTGCGKFKYICGEIRKNNPNPDFELINRTPDAPRGCAKVTCKDRGSSEPKTVQFESVTPTGVELFVGEKNKVSTDVDIVFNQANTDPDTAGENLWQLSLWYSKDEDGEGRATGLVESTLSQEQGAQPVDNFNPFVFEGLPTKVDLRDAIGCGKYKYICAQIRKDDPEPDYEQIGKSRAATVGCAPVTCSRRNPDGSKDPVDDPNDKDPKDPKDKDKFPPDPEEDPIIEVVATTTTPVTLYLDEVNDVTTDVAVTFDTDDIIKGSDLWEMSNWFSKQKDGSGKQTNFQESVLTSRQRGKTVKPNKDLTYVELPQSVDLTDGSGCAEILRSGKTGEYLFPSSSSDSGVCQICLKQPYRYTCPRCNVPYCSSTCYKDQKHAECSESFYKENFMEALKDSDMSVEEKKRMGEMLQRLEIENPADSDDEYSDNEQSLAERLQGVDLDADDPDVVWERLTEAERLEFAQILKSENLGMLVSSWKPWWMQHDAELIKVVKQEGLDTISLGSSQSSTSVPKAISSIPKLSEILKNNEPSPLVVYDIINVIFSYTLLIRFYNGEVTEFTIELAQHLLDISQALSANKNYTSTEEAVHSAIEHVTKSLKEAGKQRLNCLQDVTHILLGKSPSHPLDYVEGALSDCWRIASSAKKSVAKDSSQKQFQKQLFGCKKKLEFHLAWAAEFPENFKIAAIEVQCLHRTLLQEEQLQRKVESSFDTKIRKKHSETKPSKLIEEITK